MIMPENRTGGIVLQMPAEHSDARDVQLLFSQNDTVFCKYIGIAEICNSIHRLMTFLGNYSGTVQSSDCQSPDSYASINPPPDARWMNCFIYFCTAYIFECNTISKII